jgi:tRNA-dihydrouridine synthase B
MLSIGPHRHDSQVIVAPMAGVTDRPFRDLCRSYGARWTVSEMVTSDSKLWHTDKSRRRLAHADESGISWVQLAGADPAMMADAARANVDLGAEIIDINMGCPAKKVCNRAAGSALLRDEDLVQDILESVTGAVDVPVTLKIRLGWSRDEINAQRIARIAEQSGIALLTVHGRTRACRFAGQVDYAAIGEVKDAVRIPVIANGDIDTPQKAAEVLQLTGADGIMIGRAAQGQPWLPGQIDRYLQSAGEEIKAPSLEEIRLTLQKHLAALHGFYGEFLGVRIARKHIGWTLDQLPHGAALKRRFNRVELPSEQFELIDGVRDLPRAA